MRIIGNRDPVGGSCFDRNGEMLALRKVPTHILHVENLNPKSLSESKGGPVYITKVIGNEIFHGKMTHGEAVAGGLFSEKGYSLIPEGEHRAVYAGKGIIRCPGCGRHRKEFEASGRFGCPTCFETFADGLPRMLRRMHRGGEHLGKIPSFALSADLLVQRRAAALREMELAIRTERYEDAAVLRDRISWLDGKIDELQREEFPRLRARGIEGEEKARTVSPIFFPTETNPKSS